MRKWSRFSYEELQDCEEKLIKLSRVDIRSKPVSIGSGNYLYTQYCGNPSNPVMILLHGYCGASMIYYKILEQLTEKFYVIMIDLLGMGRSSRPDFNLTKLSDCENFFVSGLEIFRQQENLQKFSIAGHSFGAYIAGCYSILFPTYIERIIFISPIGICDPPPNWDYISFLKDQDWKLRWIMKFLSFFWVKNITPVSLFRKLGPLSNKFMEIYSSNKLKALGSDKDIMKSYLEQINLLPGSGELSLIYILNPGGVAIKPLWRRLKDFQSPMLFFYGDQDWIKPTGAETLSLINDKVSIKIVQNAGHDLYWDNPSDFIEKLFESILKTKNH